MRSKVLLVNDDAKFLDIYKRDLQGEFNIVTALGIEQGLGEVTSQGPYGVVVADFNMQGMNGLNFLNRARQIHNPTVCILLAGQEHLETAIKAVNAGNIFKFLTKPFKSHVLSKTLNAGIQQYQKNSSVKDETKKSPRSIRKILIVDDDPNVRSIISSTLKSYDEYGVLTAENGKVATKILEIIKIDLVITDLEMPEMNGFELLSYINNNCPQIPVIVLAWSVTNVMETKIKGLLGSCKYLEKPLDINAITEMIYGEFNRGGGQIQGISTSAFLQLVEVEEKTCTLTVKSQNRVGYMYFLKGGLIDAETDGLQGEKAAYNIISWEKSLIEIEDICRKEKKEINKPLMMILMEATKLKDEAGSEKEDYRYSDYQEGDAFAV
jgi:DNA-binding NtrC family response regulator